MLTQPSSQALLARGSVRTALASSAQRHLAVARPLSLQATKQEKSASLKSDTASSKPRALSPSAPQQKVGVVSKVAAAPVAQTVPSTSSTTGGRQRRRRDRPLTAADKIRQMLKWSWLEPGTKQRQELQNLFNRNVTSSKVPGWFDENYELARSFRSARSRLWTPTAQQASEFAGKKVEDVDAWIDEQLNAHRQRLARQLKGAESREDTTDVADQARDQILDQVTLWETLEREEQIDLILRPVWSKLTPKQKQSALLRLRYECIRKLGWRYGYSSGFPRPLAANEKGEVDPTAHLPKGLGKTGQEGLDALKELREREEEAAWAAWLALAPAKRVQEEKAAWELRDRSQIYLDDSEDCAILGSAAPRWFPTPERAGQMTFLPNTIVRLVKNHTPAGQMYDPWKATFRVSLSMHKHALRSYLSSIYGLKTTWARSSIYRSPVTRTGSGKVVSGKGRTWKKVEVGLLEPFLFPEVSPDFKSRELMQSELDYERARVYMKITRTSRWRSKKSIAEYEQEIRNAEARSYDGLTVEEAERVGGAKRAPGSETPRARFIVRTTGLPSAKHGKILKLLAEKRAEKERAVEALMAQYKAGNKDAASATNQQ